MADNSVRTLSAQRFLPLWRDGGWGRAKNGDTPGSAAAGGTVQAAVADIIGRVRNGGEQALLDLTARYDGVRLERLEVDRDELVRASATAPAELAAALDLAAGRIRRFAQQAHNAILMDGGQCATGQSGAASAPAAGVREFWCPLERVGLYAPGGRAPYPSSVLMAAVPAKVAGVREITLCTPPGPDGSVPAPVAAAALLSGADRVFLIGGAQAVAAMAFGAGGVPRVDKIAGPGNEFVTEAKRQLFGVVGMDGLAGPSEVLAVAGHRDAARAAAWQLLAQAEHDPQALPLAVVVPPLAAETVLAEIASGLQSLPVRCREAAAQALSTRGAVIAAGSLDEAAKVIEAVRPEHLWIDLGCRQTSAGFAGRVAAYAGAVFVGPHSPVAMGDYIAGPSHVLPTAGTARWGSPLGVADFMRRVSWVELDSSEALAIGPAAAVIARHEGFFAHERSLRMTIDSEVTPVGEVDG